MLTVLQTRGVGYGDRCSRKAAPNLWNNLPVNTRKSESPDATFKKKVKTNLFISAFNT